MLNSDLFKIEGVHAVEGFYEEFFQITNEKADRDQIYKKVRFCLSMLANTPAAMINTLCETKQFENVTGIRDMYAIRILTKSNLRILFSYTKEGGILLHSFFEKQGKKTTSYSGHTPIAKRRLQEYRKGGN